MDCDHAFERKKFNFFNNVAAELVTNSFAAYFEGLECQYQTIKQLFCPVSSDIPYFLQSNIEMFPKFLSQQLPSTYLSFHYSLFIIMLHTTHTELQQRYYIEQVQ